MGHFLYLFQKYIGDNYVLFPLGSMCLIWGAFLLVLIVTST